MNTVGLLGLTFPIGRLIRAFLWMFALLLVSFGANVAQWREITTGDGCRSLASSNYNLSLPARPH